MSKLPSYTVTFYWLFWSFCIGSHYDIKKIINVDSLKGYYNG